MVEIWVPKEFEPHTNGYPRGDADIQIVVQKTGSGIHIYALPRAYDLSSHTHKKTLPQLSFGMGNDRFEPSGYRISGLISDGSSVQWSKEEVAWQMEDSDTRGPKPPGPMDNLSTFDDLVKELAQSWMEEVRLKVHAKHVKRYEAYCLTFG